MSGPDGAIGTGPVLVVTPHELDLLEDAHARALGIDVDGEGLGDPAGDAVRPRRARGGSAARAEALLSLQGRGLLDAHGALVPDSPLADLVLVMLDVRLAAEALLVVERRLAGAEDRPDLRLLHLVAAGGVVEDLHPGGWHGLDLLVDPDLLADHALAPVLHPEAVAGVGGPVRLDLADPDEAAATLGARVLAELTLARPDAGTEESVLLAVGASGCHVATTTAPPPTGTVGSTPSSDSRSRPALTFAPTTPEAVRAMVQEWVARVVEPLQDGDPGPGLP